MQKCPIGHIEDMFLFSLRYKTVRGQANLPDYAAEALGFESCVGKKMARDFCLHIHTHILSLPDCTEERQNNTDSSKAWLLLALLHNLHKSRDLLLIAYI